MIDDSTIRQVHDRADIMDVVSRYQIQLSRRGAHYWACCPFHTERTPSFIVSPSRNTYHCFSCGAHGSPIDFVMNLDNKSYPEAIEHLAGMFGIQVLHNEKIKTKEQIDKDKHRESMLAAVGRLQEFFVEQLAADTPESEQARQYAYSRWGEQYCKEVGIGYAPASWDAVRDYCQRNCLDEHILEDAGVLKYSDKAKKFYSIFRERITIPITDKYGKVIAFTARYIGSEPDAPKYLNSAESEIFKKGETVFGFRYAQRQASKAGRFIIVEGAPDVLRLQSDDVELTETVATLGTAWSEAQFKQLQRYAPSLVFLPDADLPKPGEQLGAGVKAVMRSGLTAMRMGFDVTVRDIPLAEHHVDVPYFDFELEKMYEMALQHKIEFTRKFITTSRKKLAEVKLSEEEIKAIPRTHTIATLYSKNDPDTYITGPDSFSRLEDELI